MLVFFTSNIKNASDYIQTLFSFSITLPYIYCFPTVLATQLLSLASHHSQYILLVVNNICNILRLGASRKEHDHIIYYYYFDHFIFE